MRDRKSTHELLAAYVDGVTELSPEERRRVEAKLADDPTLRDAETKTRELLGQLRELSPQGGEPDWSALERSINDAVGPELPRPWWRRWRWVVPGAVLATTAAVALLVLRPAAEPVVAPPIPSDVPRTPVSTEIDTTLALYLDGSEIEVELEGAEAELLDDSFDDVTADDPAVADGFLSPADLAWVDDLDDDAVEQLDGYLKKKG
ncbi:MAG: hypothetical protein ABI867_18795 [Kofleriaceae bacterium]